MYHIAYHSLQEAGKGIIPLFPKEDTAKQDHKADKVCRLLENILGEEGPYTHQNFHNSFSSLYLVRFTMHSYYQEIDGENTYSGGGRHL